MRLALRSSARRGTAAALAGTILAFAAVGTASATPLVKRATLGATDYKIAGVSGTGSSANGGGTGDITLSGVSGPVTKAYLLWSGIGDAAVGGPYTPSSIKVNGTTVNGVSQGESGSNCWGTQITSRAYLADVTALVSGNGVYHLTGLGPGGNDSNGAHLVVAYNDGNSTNNRDLYLYFGNDSNAAGFPGEDLVWHDVLDNVKYPGGAANLILATADGQNFGDPGDDGALTVGGPGGSTTFPDSGLFDGSTLPDAGHSRASNGMLYDLNTFDVTSAFGPAGVQSLTLDASLVSDCLAITMAAVDVAAAPPPLPGSGPTVSIAPASMAEGSPPLPAGRNFTSLGMMVTLSQPSASPTKVTLQTSDGTATSPSDYKGKTQTVTIPAGQTSVRWGIDVVADTVAESDEFFYGVIQSVNNGYAVGTGTAVATINNDD